MGEQKKRILLVEDEPHLAFNIEFNLQSEGFEVIPAITGNIALQKFRECGPFDLIVMDIMIPEVNGLEVTKIIRSVDNRTGILILTAMSSEDDIINGLEAGADDYLTKPFQLREFLLRVRRMAERSRLFTSDHANNPKESIIRTQAFVLDQENLVLKARNETFALTVLEAKLLNEFYNNRGKVLSREYLLRKVWGLNGNVETRTVDNFILRLRKYIEYDPSKPLYLKSVRGRGYRFEERMK